MLFVSLAYPVLQSRAANMRPRPMLIGVGVCSCLLCLYLWCSEPANPAFLGPLRILMFFGLGLAIVIVLLRAPAHLFAIGFIGLLAATNALVNPVMAGLDPLLKSAPGEVIRKLVRDNPTAGWVAYESNANSEFLMAMGANVVSGIKTVPDLDFYKLLDPSGHQRSVYNGYSCGHFVFHPDRTSVGVQLIWFPTHVVSIHPLNAALRAHHVTYFLFTQPFANPAREGLELIRALPQNKMWIYTVAPAAAPQLARAALYRSYLRMRIARSSPPVTSS